jgi:hypothetical protein
MGNRNSLETYVSLTMQLFRDIAQCYPDGCEVEGDLMKMRKRIDSEGFSFLTKTLPSLAKAIDFALTRDEVLSVDGFKQSPGSVIPKFLGWLLGRIFTTDGYVKKDLDVTALRHARQLLYFTYKLDIPYDKTTEKSVIESFVRTEEELHLLDFSSQLDSITKRARTLVSRVFVGFDPRDIIPRHGPGAVSTGERVGEKSNFSRIYPRLDAEYPFTEYFTLGESHIVDQLDWIQSLATEDQATAKVVLVPKDSRGPRLISCEPLELQWIQQGLQRAIYPLVEKHRLTRGHVNFTNQEVNRQLALEGSRTRKYVTLDMKDASDRVSLRLVEELFCGTSLLQALKACRSDFTRLPDGRLVHLSKFAPMGSAVCFPIEALCFWALAVSVLSLHGRSLRYALQNVYVYGDDIIVRDKDYHLLLKYFPLYGLMFNERKCCTGGFFRESCGCDAYKGVEVTPIRLRTRWSHRDKLSASELASYIELSNSLYTAGYWGTSDLIRSMVSNRYGKIPFVPSGCKTLLGFWCDHVNHHETNKVNKVPWRLNQAYNVVEYRSWVVVPKLKKFRVDGWRECLRVLNTGSTGSDTGVYALPRRSCLQRGWRRME